MALRQAVNASRPRAGAGSPQATGDAGDRAAWGVMQAPEPTPAHSPTTSPEARTEGWFRNGVMTLNSGHNIWDDPGSVNLVVGRRVEDRPTSKEVGRNESGTNWGR